MDTEQITHSLFISDIYGNYLNTAHIIGLFMDSRDKPASATGDETEYRLLARTTPCCDQPGHPHVFILTSWGTRKEAFEAREVLLG